MTAGIGSKSSCAMRRAPKSTARRKLRANLSMRSLRIPVRPLTMPRWRASKAEFDSLTNEFRRHLEDESEELLANLDARDFAAVRRGLARVRRLRDELDEKIGAVRNEMLKVSYGAVATIRSEQTEAVLTSAAGRCLSRSSG